VGQYYTPANLTKGEYLDPEILGDGQKLYSIALSLQPGGVASALVLLLAHRDDLPSASVAEAGEVVGRWAGDEVILLGDEQGSEDVEERLSAMPDPMKDITPLVREEMDQLLRGGRARRPGRQPLIRRGPVLQYRPAHKRKDTLEKEVAPARPRSEARRKS
jgi:hypothetical protein